MNSNDVKFLFSRHFRLSELFLRAYFDNNYEELNEAKKSLQVRFLPPEILRMVRSMKLFENLKKRKRKIHDKFYEYHLDSKLFK
jgi:hypothetical protein